MEVRREGLLMGELRRRTLAIFSAQYLPHMGGVENFTKENEILFQSSFKAAFISGVIQPAMGVINNLNYVVICVLGGLWIVGGGPFGMAILAL